MGCSFGVFHDKSVDTREIPKYLTDQSIHEKARDEYLRDSTVTILLVGVETRQRKHVDWELYSSMFDGIQKKKSGILAINLPSTGCSDGVAAHGEEERSETILSTHLGDPLAVALRLHPRFLTCPIGS